MRRALLIAWLVAAQMLATRLDAAAAGGRLPDAQPRPPLCTCRFRGENVALGSRRCLVTPEGPRMAECVLELNVTSWRTGPDRCPEASQISPRS